MFQAVCWEYRERKYPGQHKIDMRKSAMEVEFELEASRRIKKSQAVAVMQKASRAIMDARQTMLGDRSSTYRTPLASARRALSDEDLLALSASQIRRLTPTAPPVTELHMGSLRLHSSGISVLIDAILPSSSNATLHGLILSRNDVCDDAAPAIATLLSRNHSIHTLDLSDNNLTGGGVAAFSTALASNTSLRTLSLCNNPVGDEGVGGILAALETNTSLRTLTLAGCSISPRGAHLLSGALEANTVCLQSLTLCEGAVQEDGDAMAEMLGRALTANTGLTSLSLPASNVTDTGFGAICTGLMTNRTLRLLNVRGNRVGSWGAARLGEVLGVCTSLQRLDLSSNDIVAGVECASLLRALQHNTSVTTLLLVNNPAASMQGFAEGVAEALAGNKKRADGDYRAKAAWIQEQHSLVSIREERAAEVMQRARAVVRRERAKRVASNPPKGITGSLRGTPAASPSNRRGMNALEVVEGLGITGSPYESLRSIRREEEGPEGEGRGGEEEVGGEGGGGGSEEGSEEDPEVAERKRYAKILEEERARAKGLLARLVPGKRLRLTLHRNHPRRLTGIRVVLPGHVHGEGLWHWLLSEANRLLKSPSWPLRVVFLDSPVQIGGEGGPVLPVGTQLGADDLVCLTDGCELVFSDGRGDGVSSLRGFNPRGGLTVDERRIARRNQAHITGQHWSVSYWGILARFYRAKRALLDWDYERGLRSSASTESMTSTGADLSWLYH